MRTGSAPFRPSGLASQPAQPDTGEYLALEKGRLVVVPPAQPGRGFLGALLKSRPDSKALSQSAPSSSQSSSSRPSSSVSSSDHSPVSESQVGGEVGNRQLHKALGAYAARLKLPADSAFNGQMTLLERQCAVLSPEAFGRSALKVFEAAKAEAGELGGTTALVRGVMDRLTKVDAALQSKPGTAQTQSLYMALLTDSDLGAGQFNQLLGRLAVAREIGGAEMLDAVADQVVAGLLEPPEVVEGVPVRPNVFAILERVMQGQLVRSAMVNQLADGNRAEFTGFASTIQSTPLLRSPGCHLELHRGRLVVVRSMEGLSPDEVRLAKRVDSKILKGEALTDAEEQLQIKREENGKRFMRASYAEGVATEDGKYGAPKSQLPVSPEQAAVNRDANAPVLDAVVKRLKEQGVVPALIAQLKESMGPLVEGSTEMFAYRLAFRTKSWDSRLQMVRSASVAERLDQITSRLDQHMKSGSMGYADVRIMPRILQRACELALDQEMALQHKAARREKEYKSKPSETPLAPLKKLSIEDLTDIAIKELRVTQPSSPLPQVLPSLLPPLPPKDVK